MKMNHKTKGKQHCSDQHFAYDCDRFDCLNFEVDGGIVNQQSTVTLANQEPNEY